VVFCFFFLNENEELFCWDYLFNLIVILFSLVSKFVFYFILFNKKNQCVLDAIFPAREDNLCPFCFGPSRPFVLLFEGLSPFEGGK
jgi:hypothetical protein